MLASRIPPILLIEDDDTDTELMIRSLNKRGLRNPFFHARDGLEALEKIEREKLLHSFPQPILIILDINMPRMNGFKFLEELRKNTLMNKSLVFILTTSTQDSDLNLSYQYNVAGYFLKEKTKGLVDILSLYTEMNTFSDHLN